MSNSWPPRGQVATNKNVTFKCFPLISEQIIMVQPHNQSK